MIFSHDLSGQTYFQQHVDYKINVKLNDKNHTLSAFEELEYTNNSPDVLNEIWIHLWANAYRNNQTSLVKQQVSNGNLKLYFADDAERGYIDSLDFKVNGEPVAFESPQIDYGRIKLNSPLLPGGKITITTPFFVKIPNARFSRLGHDKQAYYISQWYPKPAVYDAKGWHPMPYLDIGEFYSEFGDYNVTIELPANYVVGATGQMLNDSAEYAWMTKNAEETAKQDSFGTDMSFPRSDVNTKTLTFMQSNVHDFAWFADKRWHVLKSEVVLPHTKRKVTTWSMFTNSKASIWKNSTQYIDSTLYYYSLWNGDYLYNSYTAVDGVISAGVGMEYPMITICGGESDSLLLEITIAHEAGHSWFYGMLASNERDHPWMDEGINSFYEMRYFLTRYPKEIYGNKNELMLLGRNLSHWLGLVNLDYKEAWQLEYAFLAATHVDQPIEFPSENYSPENYGTIVYRKTGITFQYLRSYLGDSIFDNCMQQYFNTWKLKHPYPEDFKTVFINNAGKNLDWFFNDLLKTTNTIDYKIKKISNQGNSHTLSLVNKTGVVAPLILDGLRNDTVIASMKLEGFNRNHNVDFTCESCNAFEIDALHNMPDINRSNNNIRSKGIFKKMEPVSIGLLPKFHSTERTNLSVLPAIGLNEYNKLMAGLSFYNYFLPAKKFEYAIAAMYGTSDHQLAGTGVMNYNIYKQTGCFDLISFSVSGKRFAYLKSDIRESLANFRNVFLHYNRIETGVDFSVRNKAAASKINNQFGVSLIELFSQNTELKQRVVVNDSMKYNITGVSNNTNNTIRAYVSHNNKRILDPFDYKIIYEGNSNYGKLAFTGNYHFNYKNTRRGVECRFFAGSFIYNKEAVQEQYPFSLSSWDGQRDYWFDEYYFGRSENSGVLSQQMSLNDGGFKIDVPYARVTSWITTFNFKAALPDLPLHVFLDVGTFKNAKQQVDIYNDNILIDGGICFSTMNDVFEIYLPFIKSKGIMNYVKDHDVNFWEQVRFVFNLKLMNPLDIRKQLF